MADGASIKVVDLWKDFQRRNRGDQHPHDLLGSKAMIAIRQNGLSIGPTNAAGGTRCCDQGIGSEPRNNIVTAAFSDGEIVPFSKASTDHAFTCS